MCIWYAIHFTCCGKLPIGLGWIASLSNIVIRYDPADVSKIALFREDEWIDDIGAKELRLPDGSHKLTSLWEVETAKFLAREENGDSRDLASICK